MSKLSPIQLVDFQPLKMMVELTDGSLPYLPGESNQNDIGLEFYKSIQKSESTDLLDVSSFAKDNCYQVSLGVRSALGRPYAGFNLEFLYTGRFICTTTFQDNKQRSHSPEEMAYQYGLSILYGSVRESFAMMAARMGAPRVTLPVLTFMGEQPPKALIEQATTPN
jgi:hypothetical protein